MSEDHEAHRWIVRGTVQGVGFRMFVAKRAQQLGLRGTVRNAVDGSVEVVCAGDSNAVRRLEAALLSGPGTSTVKSVEELVFEGEPSALPHRFAIVP